MRRPAHVVGAVSLVVALGGSPAVAQNTLPWPPPTTMLQKIYISYIFAKDPAFWRDGHGLEGVKYRDNPNRPELQQVMRTTTGYEVIKNGLMELESFEVTGTKEGTDSAGLPTFSASYHAQLVSTMTFQVVPIKDGTGWRPDVEISNGPDLDYAVYVEKGLHFTMKGTLFFIHYSPTKTGISNVYEGPAVPPPPPPQQPPAARPQPVVKAPEAAPWWKK